MKKYERPDAVVLDEVNEGVYAASGASADCWTGDIHTTQDWNGQAHVYQIGLHHSKKVTHFSEACTVTVTFDIPVTNAWAEGAGNYQVDGIGTNKLTITRIHHANGEYSGDEVTYKLFAVATDEATSKILNDVPQIDIVSCDKHGTPNYPEID